MAILKAINGHDPEVSIPETFGLTQEEWVDNGHKVAAMLDDLAQYPTITEKYEKLYKHIGKNSQDFELMLIRFLAILDRFTINFVESGEGEE